MYFEILPIFRTSDTPRDTFSVSEVYSNVVGIIVHPEHTQLFNSFTVMCKTVLHLRVHAVLGLSRHTFTAVATATLIYKVITLIPLLTANYRRLSATA
jgi:hypothetical protein